MKWLTIRFKVIAYFLLSILLQEYSLSEAFNATSVRATAVVEGANDGSVFQSDGSAGNVSRDVTGVNTQGSVHLRTLKQSTDDLPDEDEFDCGLSSSERRRYFDDATNQWLVTNEVLRELDNDIQAIVNCTSENDVVEFVSRRVIRPATTITAPWNLTLRADSSVTLTCPRRGPLLVVRASSVTLENLVVASCNDSSSVIVLSPRCDNEMEQGISLLRHLTFRDNGVFEEGHLIEANGRCSNLNITSLVFLRNKCIGTHCVVFGARNTLVDIHLVSNQGSNETSMDSSIFFVSGSETTATNVTSSNNTIRSFYVSSGDLGIADSHFDGSRRNQSSRTREESIGGGVLFSNHSSVSISNTIFKNNYAFNGGAMFAWSSNISINDCAFRENDAGEGNGGALYGHYNSSFNISSSLFSKNRGYFGAGVYSNFTMRVDMMNVSFLENNCSRSCSILVDNGFARIESGAFFRNSAGRAAAALCAQASNLSLKNSTFVGNSARFGGACIFQDNSTINASNLLFENNVAREGDGGAINCVFGGRMRLRDSVFQNNSASSDGGAIYTEGECETTLKKVVFSNNTSGDYAGALQIWAGNFTGSNLTFTKNRARNFGGAISFYEANNVSVSNSLFEDNNAENAGAIHFFTTASGHINRCTFVENLGHNIGGVTRASTSNLSISSCVFRANTSPLGGSLFLVNSCNCTIMDSRFENNVASGNGGAINLFSNSALVLSNSSFSENRAQVGGVLYVSDYSNASISRVQFDQNYAYLGGCLYFYDFGRISVSDSLFSNNKANSGTVYLYDNSTLSMSNSTLVGNRGRSFAGGVYVSSNSSVELTNVRFANNEARWGGALFVSNSCDATVSSCSFINNTALDNGGVNLRVTCSISISNSTFTGNKASYGGGLCIFNNCTALVMLSDVARNNASTSGGGIYLDGSNMFLSSTRLDLNTASYGGSLYNFNASMEVTNSTVKRSHARRHGGAIYMRASNASIDTTRLDSNEAIENGGGIALINASSLLCYSCSIVSSRAFSGAGLYVYSNNSILIVAQFQNSRFKNNSAKSYGGGIEFAAPQNRSINCNAPNVTCGHIVLLNTSFVENYANHSGAIVLTTEPNWVLVDCKDGRKRQELLVESDINSMQIVNPKQMCASWKRNRVSSKEYEGGIGTYGQEIVLTIDPEDEVKIVGSTRTGFALENVSSGKQLPTINVTIIDGYGVGPAPTLPHSFEAWLSSPDGFFLGLYPANISAGSGTFTSVAGFARPGNYTLELRSDSPSLETLNVVVTVRGCEVGEEATTNGLTCQACDAFSYNFNASQVSACKECPGEATCRGRYIVPKNGHWHKSPCHDTIQECLIEEACTYEDRQKALVNFTWNSTDCNINKTTTDSYNDVLCNEGYKGPLCGSCKKAFGLSMRYLCLKCSGAFLSLMTVVGITLYLLGASSLTIRGCLPSNLRPQDYQPSPGQSASASETSYRDPEVNIEMVKMMVEGHVPREYIEQRQMARAPPKESRSNQQETEHELTRWKTTEIFKIMLNFLQTIAVAATISVKWTRGMLVLFAGSEYVGVLTTVALSRPVDCITASSSAVAKAIWRMIVSLLVPGFVVSILVSAWGYIALKEKRGWSYFWKRFTLSAIAVTYISYLGLTKMAVRAFYCVSIYNSSSSSTNTKDRFWAVDTAIKCYGKEHSGIIAIAVVVICVITVCFPLASAIILSRNKEEQKKRDSWIFETAGFLFRVFKEKLVFWESVVMFRKACLSLTVVFSNPLGGDSQGLLASVLLLFCLYLQLTLKPYRKEFKRLNQLESISLLVSAVTFNLSLFFVHDRCSDLVRTLLATIIIFANCMFFLFLLFSFAYSTIAHLRVALRYENIPISDNAPWWVVIKVYITSRSCSGVHFSTR